MEEYTSTQVLSAAEAQKVADLLNSKMRDEFVTEVEREGGGFVARTYRKPLKYRKQLNEGGS